MADFWTQVAPQLDTQANVTGLTVFNGKIYGGTSSGNGGRLFEFNGTNAWVEVAPRLAGQNAIEDTVLLNGKVYGGTSDGGSLYEWNGTNAWVEVAPQVGAEVIRSLVVFNSKIYAGTNNLGKLFEWNGTNAWVEVAPQLNGEAFIHSLIVFNSKLYGGTGTNGLLYEWNGTNAWGEVAAQLNSQIFIYELVILNNRLYGSTGSGGRLFLWSGEITARARVMGGGSFQSKREPRHLPPSGAPELLLHNTTEEDSDGGRESVLRWKGEQTGGELSTLATITGSHDGAADDEKGKLDLAVNLTSDGDTPTTLLTLNSNSEVIIQKLLTMTPSAVANITAGGGITVTNAHMRVQGDGGAVDITANPQIAAGVEGEFLLLQGASDTNTVTLDHGTGLHLHGGSYTMRDHDYILFSYDDVDNEWEEITRSAPSTEKAWHFLSQVAGSGTNYFGGFYEFNSGDDDFTVTQTLGVANASYAAHAFLVLGANTVDTLTIRISGTSIDDEGNRVGSDTEDLVFTHPAVVGDYVEGPKKWIGQISIDHIAGTAKTCNWGFAKYWDNQNSAYILVGLEATWRGGATDADPDLQVIHHKPTGWTYNVGSTPTPPATVASMKTDHTPEYIVQNNVPGAWKRTDLNEAIDGGNGEGTILVMVTNANKTFEMGNFLLRVRSS